MKKSVTEKTNAATQIWNHCMGRNMVHVGKDMGRVTRHVSSLQQCPVCIALHTFHVAQQHNQVIGSLYGPTMTSLQLFQKKQCPTAKYNNNH